MRHAKVEMLMESIIAKHEERRFRHVLLSSLSFLAACSVPLGLSTGEIKDWQITASSIDEQRREQCQASFVRLYSNGNDYAWCPRINQPHQWIQVDLGTPTKVSGRSQLLEKTNCLLKFVLVLATVARLRLARPAGFKRMDHGSARLLQS